MAIDLDTPTIAPPTAEEVTAETTTTSTDTTGNTVAPPPQPTYDTIQGGLEGTALSGLNQQQGRYDIPWVQQSMDLIDTRIEESGDYARANLDERMSQRGLLGSSVEADFAQQLERGLDTERMSYLTDLQGRIADAAAQDRQSAFANAMQVQGLGISTEQLALERDKFTAEYADRQADRMFRAGLQEDSQEFQSMQSALDRSLETLAMQLRSSDARYATDAEGAWREADRLLEDRIQTRALELEAEGQSAETAWRMAAIELDRVISEEQEATRRAQLFSQSVNDYNQIMQQRYASEASLQGSIFDAMARYAASTGDPDTLTSGLFDWDLANYPTYTLNSPSPTYGGADFGQLDLANMLSWLQQFRDMSGPY